MILTAFRRESDFRGHQMIRTISSGKSAQFPVLGRTQAQYHVPGTELTGKTIRSGEKEIFVEDFLIADVFVSNIDELISHFDVRAPYAAEIAQALAKAYDKDVSRTIIRSARAAAHITGETGMGGSVIANAAMDTDGDIIQDAIYEAGVFMDMKDVPKSQRVAFLKPVQFHLLVRAPGDSGLGPQALHRDFNDANGSIKEGDIKMVNSIPVRNSNNFAQEDDRSNTQIPAIRREDYSVSMGTVSVPSAAGSVHLQDVTTESEYDIRRQGTLLLGKYLVGHDYLRPEGAVELRTGEPST